ncbi:MAG: universal stress protein [Microbacterium sp.]|uniref:universal stress protein n=1 Tax=Microbacterium sp. TaxID=51671 RepID=UPI003F803995
MEANTDADRIVVGVDGSDSSIAALRYAARLADAFDAPLEAVTTWMYPAFADPVLIAQWPLEQTAADMLDDAVVRAFGDSVPEGITRTVLAGPAARRLTELSRSCSMLVVGSRGRGGFTGLLLGSVSAACAEHAACPVVVVHGVHSGSAASPPADG